MNLRERERREDGEDCRVRSFIPFFSASPNIIRVIKSRRKIWAACNTHEENKKCILSCERKTRRGDQLGRTRHR